jgi:hypothetical protein
MGRSRLPGGFQPACTDLSNVTFLEANNAAGLVEDDFNDTTYRRPHRCPVGHQ